MLTLVFIVILSFCLRIYQVGTDSFWFDEAGIALAVTTDTPGQMIKIVEEHAAAMPLDYMVAWVMARFYVSDGWLRLPSVLWGVATIIICAALFREMGNQTISALGALFLALSAIHIHYSQELKFYASEIFFYMLSTYLIWKLLHDPTWKKSFWLIVLTIIGIYFHIYVLLSLTTGFIWIWVKRKDKDSKKAWVYYLLSVILIVLATIPGYLFFNMDREYSFYVDLLSAIAPISTGLGWVPLLHSNTYDAGWLWGSELPQDKWTAS
ncbi:MAG: glycosyltransferase family 39 protein [Bacteroidales bacterium]|nr:glycosyltransferase family 39 protein [Bacteroidales bacterium]